MPLDPEIAAYLEAQKALPPRASLTLEQTRARMVESGCLYGGEQVAVAEVEDRVIGAGLRVRDYRPGPDPLGLVVYFHGGRFISGNLDTHDAVCRRLAIAAGCRVVAVDYRLAPEHRFRAAVDDALAAVDWATGESGHIAVAGDSAGANLAAVVAGARRSVVRCQVLIYPMIDATRALDSHREFGQGFGPASMDMKRGWDEYLPENVDPRNPEASPLFRTDWEGLPAALVLTASHDCLRDEGEQYGHKLGEGGNRVEMKRYSGAIHGFVTLPGISALARAAIEDAAGYLRRTLR